MPSCCCPQQKAGVCLLVRGVRPGVGVYIKIGRIAWHQNLRSGDHRHRPATVRHRLCYQFFSPHLSDPIIFRFGQGHVECWNLLYGNAAGRLVGCLLSGISCQLWGLTGCLATASVMVLAAGTITIVLANEHKSVTNTEA